MCLAGTPGLDMTGFRIVSATGVEGTICFHDKADDDYCWVAMDTDPTSVVGGFYAHLGGCVVQTDELGQPVVADPRTYAIHLRRFCGNGTVDAPKP